MYERKTVCILILEFFDRNPQAMNVELTMASVHIAVHISLTVLNCSCSQFYSCLEISNFRVQRRIYHVSIRFPLSLLYPVFSHVFRATQSIIGNLTHRQYKTIFNRIDGIIPLAPMVLKLKNSSTKVSIEKC